MLTPEDTVIERLGPSRYESPLRPAREGGFISESARVLMQADVSDDEPLNASILFEKAGPRQKLFFDPSATSRGDCHLRRALSRPEQRHSLGHPGTDPQLWGAPRLGDQIRLPRLESVRRRGARSN